MIKTPITLTHITTSIMSLLDNKKGLTMLSALFLLFACEEPSELPLGISPKQGNISSHYIEIPVEAEQFRLDSTVMSSLSSANTAIYIGRLTDPYYGKLAATAYTNVGALNTAPEIPAGTNLDSAYLTLTYNNNFIGRNLWATQSLKVYRLPQAIAENPVTTSGSLQHRYSINDSKPTEGARLIGEVQFDTATVKNHPVTNNIVWIRLNNDFAAELWQDLKDNPGTFTNQEAFNQYLGSLAFVPGENNTFITGYSFQEATSGIDLYYGQSAVSFEFLPKVREDKRAYAQYPTYYSLQADYSGTALEGIEGQQANIPFQTSDNQLYYRSGVGLLPKISFPALEEFVTSTNLSNVVINSAVLEIDSIRRRTEINLTAPSQLSFYLVEDKNNNRFAGVNNETYAGAQLMGQQYITAQQDTLIRYRADIAEEIEYYFINKDSKYLQGMLYNGNTTSPASLSGFIADPKRMVLKIYYTILEESNQEN